MRGAYGLMAREVIGLLKHLQHAQGKTMILVGILEKVTDEFGRVTWQPQMEGGKAGRELPGIVDQVVSMALFSPRREGTWRHDPERGSRAALRLPRWQCLRSAREGPFRAPRRNRTAGPRRAPPQDQHQRHQQRVKRWPMI